MPTAKRPRRGSLQFWPRKRAKKFLPSVNWKHISSDSPSFLGFIAYKVGMATALVKDSTPKVMTSGKQVAMPVTILEVPNMKLFSVRFYKDGKVLRDIVVSNDKELKRKLKVPKNTGNLDKDVPEDADDVRVLVYSVVKSTSLKKKPDVVEVAVQGSSVQDKVTYLRPLIGKEITLDDFVQSNLFDVRGVTKGKGTQGPVKRFGITLRFHKAEKGQRKVGSIGPWHPARVTFRVPMAGQMGLHTRLVYNIQGLKRGKIADDDINPKTGFKNYGKIKTSYVVVAGSIMGPSKRQVLLTPALRPSKKQSKKTLELVEVLA